MFPTLPPINIEPDRGPGLDHFPFKRTPCQVPCFNWRVDSLEKANFPWKGTPCPCFTWWEVVDPVENQQGKTTRRRVSFGEPCRAGDKSGEQGSQSGGVHERAGPTQALAAIVSACVCVPCDSRCVLLCVASFLFLFLGCACCVVLCWVLGECYVVSFVL